MGEIFKSMQKVRKTSTTLDASLRIWKYRHHVYGCTQNSACPKQNLLCNIMWYNFH